MRFGVVILPERPWPVARTTWVAADQAGFDHAWTYDHLTWRSLRDASWFGAVPTLTAAAVVTGNIRLGPLVANPGIRHPAGFAKEMMTLDDISGGRMVCGIGAGAYDSEMLARDPLTRRQHAARFREFVELTDALLRQRPVGFRGDHYDCQEVVFQPACRQSPRMPLALAATGPAGLALAAAHADIWVTYGPVDQFEPLRFDRTTGVLRRQMAALDEACARAGRPPHEIRRLVLTGSSIGGVIDSVTAFEDAAAAFAAIGVTDMVVHWPRASPPYAADPVVFDKIISAVIAGRAGQERRGSGA